MEIKCVFVFITKKRFGRESAFMYIGQTEGLS